MTELLKPHIGEILDCFCCTDGGQHFSRFLALIGEVEKESVVGNLAAIEISNIIIKFSNLVKITKNA